jgi:hypothetical protein
MPLLKNRLLAGLIMSIAAAAPASAAFVIKPTFDSSITGDPNAAAIEGTINSAIGIYDSLFSNPIIVNITFAEGGGLGESNFSLFSYSYPTFYAALQAGATSADDATAYARLALDGSTSNPVTSSNTVFVKPANALALGLTIPGGPPASDGTITLNTAITNPGSPGSSGGFNLLPVVEHEIDEVLGLGSTLGLTFTPASLENNPSPEDFFRFDATGHRSFTTSSSAKAFFSLNGTTDLAQFDNQNDGGDFADWQSNPRPTGVPPQVQDAFDTQGSNPVLGVEIRALDVIGYTLAVPEPSSWMAIAAALLAFFVIRRRPATSEPRA